MGPIHRQPASIYFNKHKHTIPDLVLHVTFRQSLQKSTVALSISTPSLFPEVAEVWHTAEGLGWAAVVAWTGIVSLLASKLVVFLSQH